MTDDVLQLHRIDPIIPECVPDPDLDSLYRQAQAAARKHGWNCPTREEFECAYRREMAGKIQRNENEL